MKVVATCGNYEPYKAGYIDGLKSSAIDQYKWERDLAIEQLHELGTELGEKPEIARQRIIDEWRKLDDNN